MAQQQKTYQEYFNLDDLPDLSTADQIFVDQILAGKRACDAYLLAHPEHADWLPTSINNAAYRLRNKRNIRIWVHAGRMAGLQNAGCTVETHLAELQRLSHAAEAAGNYGAAVQAEKLRGEVQGLYVSRYEDVTKGVSEKELLAKLRLLLGDAAQPIADRLGLKEQAEHVGH